jgi:hypothetical protein
MPDGPIAYDTLANVTASGADEETWFTAEIPVHGLPSGSNLVAVEVHQAARNSSDLGFDLELIGTGFQGTVPPPGMTIQPFASNRILISWPENAIGWTLFTTTSLDPSATWSPVNITPAVSNGNFYVILFTLGSSQRFYRLEKPF